MKQSGYLKTASLFAILMLSWTHCWPQDTGKPSDSTDMYCTPVWVMWEIAKDLQRLDATVLALGYAMETVGSQELVIQKYEQSILAYDSAYKAKSFECEQLSVINDLHSKRTKLQLKEAKSRGNRWMGMAGLELLFILILL